MADEFADCERRGSGWLDQDVNAWTSVAYVAAGVVLAVEVWRARLPRIFLLFAVLVAVEGVGSLMFHGSGGEAAQALHDVPLVGMVAFIAGWHVGRLWDAPASGAAIAAIAGVSLATVAFAFGTTATNVVVGAGVALVVASEFVARRRRLAPVWTFPLDALAVVALGFWFAGRPESPMCDPDGWAQPHGVWHVLTAVLALAWVDRAVTATRPDRPALMFRRATDRTFGALALTLTHVFHRSLDVRWRDRLPRDGPMLIVANHGNGFVDPIVVTAALRRLPRFLAKATLWNVVVARPFLAFAGVLPVHRASDGDRTSDNRSIFASCHRDLAQGSQVAIFPEGTTGDRAGLDRMRTGAARIALGALYGAPDLVIVPIGLAFESRVETRSRAVVMFGEPIDVSAHTSSVADEGTEPDRDEVRALTDVIEDALEAVSPSFATVDERELLRGAARTERDDASQSGLARFGDVEVVARRLAATDDDERAAVIDRYRTYAARLTVVGLDSDQVEGARLARGRLALSGLAILIAGPLLLSVTMIFVPALLIVVVGTSLVRSTATKGTVRLLLGLATGLLTLVIAAILIADGFGALFTAVALAAGGAIALVVWPPIVRTLRSIVGRWAVRDRGSLMVPVEAERAAVIDAVRAAAP